MLHRIAAAGILCLSWMRRLRRKPIGSQLLPAVRRVLTLAGCCLVLACSVSGAYRGAYGDCIDQLRSYEEREVGKQGRLLPEGIDKAEYCTTFALERTHALKQAGIVDEQIR